MKLKALAAAVFMTAAFCVYSEISFENPSLNSHDMVLFSVNHDVVGSPSYRTAFMANVSTCSDIKVLSCYPERMELLNKGAVLQVRNRYGTARYSLSDSTLAWVTKTDIIPTESIRQVPQSVSPDGKWLCYLKKTGTASAELILKNASSFAEKIIDSSASFRTNTVPVLWAPDSSVVIYEKDGQIYFCDPKAEFQKIQLTEEFRKIGKGSINSVCWAGNKTLIYIDRDLVYRVNANEFFTRGLYANMVGNGIVSGRLPVSFDSEHDKFYVNSRGNKLILIQANRVVSSFDLDVTGFSYLASTYSMPFTDMRGSVTGYNLFWCTGGDCVIWVDMIATDDGKRKSCVYRLNGKLRQLAFLEDTSDPVLSPNGKYVAFGSENSLYAYDLASWKLIGRLPGEKPVSYLWNDNASLFAGGEISVREWRLDPSFQTSGTVRTLFLSSVRNVYWKDDTRIVADSVLGGGNLFEYDTVRNTWQKTSMNLLSERLTHSVQNGRYRVFTGSTANGRYSNTLYVRTLSGKPVTRAVFLDTTVKVPVRRRVSIAFDAVDSADGLSNILSAVREYNVPATFFVNGEFIRRYPNETRQLALGGFECGSMFYTSADLTSKGFVVDEEFIRRGLARNEDEFFQTTGKELSLFWHAPLNRKNSVILKGGAQGGYRYIDTSRYSLDTVTLEMAVAKEGEYLSSSEIISRFVSNAADGDVITISTGISSGRRRDYLYENLDILISALLDNGFEIVQLK